MQTRRIARNGIVTHPKTLMLSSGVDAELIELFTLTSETQSKGLRSDVTDPKSYFRNAEYT